MNKRERAQLREKLDEEQRPVRKLSLSIVHHESWLKDVRLSLGVQVSEMAKRLNCHRTAIYQAEEREAAERITLEVLERMANAMQCHLVYTIVPDFGWTLDELAAENERSAKRARARSELRRSGEAGAESAEEDAAGEAEEKAASKGEDVVELLERISKVIKAGQGGRR